MSEIPGLNALDLILARAKTDRDFRQRLLADPRTAVAEMGTRLRADLKIKFIEKDAQLDVLIVLPDFASSAGELSHAELDLIAGGAGWPWGDPAA